MPTSFCAVIFDFFLWRQGIEWTAVFDVSVPPYEEEQGRSCGYYTPVDRTLEVTTPEQAVYLLKTECPSDYITTNVPYSGDPLPL